MIHSLNFKYATSMKERLQSLRPLSPIEVEKIKIYEKAKHIQASNALEGSTLTLYETRMILETGITISGKPLKEHLEVVNLEHAMEFVEGLVNGKEELTERHLKEIHYLVYFNLGEDKLSAGRYRPGDVIILGSQHIPPASVLIQDEMNKFFEWNKEYQDKLHPIEYAALLHEKFVTIHPFAAGNGRTARLLLNFGLTRSGYPAIYIKPDEESRTAYNKSLEHAQITGDTRPFIEIVKKRVEEKLEERVSILERKDAGYEEHQQFLKEMEAKFHKYKN